VRSSAVFYLVLATASLITRADTLARFEGDSNERTPVFETSGPWVLYWYTQSDNALPKTFELRLYRAGSGEYLGTVIQQRIIANGKKLFENAGSYSVDVVAGNIEWTLVVSEIDADKAAQLIREAEGDRRSGTRRGNMRARLRRTTSNPGVPSTTRPCCCLPRTRRRDSVSYSTPRAGA